MWACIIYCIASQLTQSEVFVKQLQYSPLMGGFAAVLSDGRAAFITADTLKFEPSVRMLNLLYFIMF